MSETDEEVARDFLERRGLIPTNGALADEEHVAALAAALRKERERCAEIAAADRALNGRRTLSSQRIEAAIRALNIPKED